MKNNDIDNYIEMMKLIDCLLSPVPIYNWKGFVTNDWSRDLDDYQLSKELEIQLIIKELEIEIW